MGIKNKVKKPAVRSKTRRQSASFPSKINLFLIAFFILATFLTVFFVQQRQDIRQKASSTNVPAPKPQNPIVVPIENIGGVGGVGNPNFVCGGSGQGSVCPSQGPNPQIIPANPDQGDPNQGNPNDNNPNPVTSGTPGEIAPGEPNPNGGNNDGNDGNNNGGGNNNGNTGDSQGLLTRIIEMLNQILQMLQQLLGGGNGNPTNPNPTDPNQPNNPNDPNNPNPNNPQPSAAPSANPGDPNNPNPNNPQPSTAAPSTAPSAAAGDTTPPTTPTNLKATVVSATQINLTWTRSTDNVGVTKYVVYRSEGDSSTGGNTGITFQKEVGTATSYSDTGLKGGVSYYYYVRAFDAATNKSEHSNTAGGKTKATAPAKNKITGTVKLSGGKDQKISIELTGAATKSTTAAHGKTYSFSSLPNGTYTVRISYGTYKSATCSVTFKKTTGDDTYTCSKTLAK